MKSQPIYRYETTTDRGRSGTSLTFDKESDKADKFCASGSSFK